MRGREGGPASGATWRAIALVVLLMGCGGAGRDRAAPTITPPDAAAGLGDTIETGRYRLTLHAVRDPATGKFPAGNGKRLVAYDVTVTAIAGGVPYNLLYARLKLADFTEAAATVVGVDPSLLSGTLAAGERVRGWRSFEIVATAVPVTLAYEILSAGDSGGKLVFDVR